MYLITITNTNTNTSNFCKQNSELWANIEKRSLKISTSKIRTIPTYGVGIQHPQTKIKML